jgi:hypothetical protein
MRMRITTDKQGYVTLAYDGEDANFQPTRIQRIFMVPADGGYVREQIGADWQQVCNRLSHYGETLYCSDPRRLPNMIRREYMAMRRAAKKQ